MTKITVNNGLLRRLRDPLANRTACDAAAVLGPLAGWWLGREARELVGLDPSLLPKPDGAIGSCVVLMSAPHYPLFGYALGLPLRWLKGTSHSAMLPGGLREEADRVLRQLSPPDDWGLHLSSEAGLNQVDLSRCDDGFTWGSSWASLAGALALAIDDIPPRPTAWATAAWSETFGVARVESVEAKLHYAIERGADVIAIPAENEGEALMALQALGKLEFAERLASIRPSVRDNQPRAILKEYLGRLSQEPSGSRATLAELTAFYRGAERKRADQFHKRTLLPLAILRNRDEARRIAEFRPKVGVTLVSKQFSVVVQGLATANIDGNLKTAILLYDDRDPDQEQEVRDVLQVLKEALGFLKEQGIETIETRPIPLDRRDSIFKAAESLFDQLIRERGHRPSEIAIDLTPGFRLGPLGLYEAADPGVWLMSCQHETMSPDLRVKPGSERYEIWSKK